MIHEDEKEPLYSDSESEDEIEDDEDQDQEEEEEEEEDEVPDADEKSNPDENEEEEDEDQAGDDDDDDDEPTATIPQLGGSGDGNDDDDEDDDINSLYLQKFNTEINKNYILDFHPECSANNYDEISVLTRVVRDKNNNIIDNLHKTIPFLTKYERTRILGQRAKQINSGATAFVKVPENVLDGYLVAEMELAQKRIPFIVRRPTPGGGCEYWNLKDLEIVSF
jgi:DNA-directed RNA polymerase subunit K/omega